MFTRNIDNKGRLLRALIAIALFTAAAFTFQSSRLLTIILALAGAFVTFEAIRGWCGLRACGIKTKI